MVPWTGRFVLPAPSRERLSCSQIVMSRGFTPPTTPGLRVPGFPLAAFPSLSVQPKSWLMERCRVLPQHPGSHSIPSPLTRISSGGSVRNLCTRRLEDQTTGASRWTHEDVHLPRAIFTPRAMQVAPSQDPATLCSTVTSPQQLDQGPIIRKLSGDGNEEQILHLILANYCTQLQSTS